MPANLVPQTRKVLVQCSSYANLVLLSEEQYTKPANLVPQTRMVRVQCSPLSKEQCRTSAYVVPKTRKIRVQCDPHANLISLSEKQSTSTNSGVCFVIFDHHWGLFCDICKMPGYIQYGKTKSPL